MALSRQLLYDHLTKTLSKSISQLASSWLPIDVSPYLDNIIRRKKYVHRKIANMVLNRIEMRLGKTRLSTYPGYLVVDPTNICNLRCPLCPTWQDKESRPKGQLSLELFKSIMDETGPYLFALNLCNWGEPLLNPHLPEIITYAKSFNMAVGLSTNLNVLGDALAEGLARSGIDTIVVSMDGATEETYLRYRQGGDFNTLIANVERLKFYLKKHSSSASINASSPTKVILQHLVNRYNENAIDDMRELARKLECDLYLAPMRTAMGTELLKPLNQRVKEIEEWLPLNPAYNKYAGPITPGTRTRQNTCRWLWSSAVVNWDGSVSPCCAVFEKSRDFGNCSTGLTGGFHKAWNTPRYELSRRLVGAYLKHRGNIGSLLKEAGDKGIICANCTRYGFLED